MYSEDYDSAYAQDRQGEDVYSKPVRAGKRTYFFDVKATKGRNDFFLTITESKRRVETDGRFSYDKHKIFLYKEDFEKFQHGLANALSFIETGVVPEPVPDDERRPFHAETEEIDLDRTSILDNPETLL